MSDNGERTDRAVFGDGEGGGEEGVAGVDADLHGLLGADELEEHVEELALVGGGRHQVPARANQDPEKNVSFLSFADQIVTDPAELRRTHHSPRRRSQQSDRIGDG